ncbi:hypothetical protein H4R34_006409 [Dimargaris verticillata]|uniref:Uncharacterized protein n=1 Tax=Dimargaris verticillata TaxID=2761393 RepID=A0A9W8ASD0_9FUNG|nr:hypothetical protein H4R34_006409 [Dimargaris verticillata]
MSRRSVSTRSSSDSDADTVEYRPNFILSDHFYQCANPTLSTPADLAKALKDHLKFDLGIQNPYAYESTDNTLEAIAKAICPETEPEPVPSSSMWTWLKWVKPRVDPNLAFAQRACIPKDDWPQTVQVFLEVHVAHNGLQLDASTRESLYSDLAAQSDLNDGELKSKFAKLMLSNELDHVQEHPSDVTKMLVAKFYGNN